MCLEHNLAFNPSVCLNAASRVQTYICAEAKAEEEEEEEEKEEEKTQKEEEEEGQGEEGEEEEEVAGGRLLPTGPREPRPRSLPTS